MEAGRKRGGIGRCRKYSLITLEAEQYSFYRVPTVLFTAECFKSLSCEAKVLYGLMLDRMSLSIKNRWFDDEDRVYIIFTVDEIAELMNCGTQMAFKLIK